MTSCIFRPALGCCSLYILYIITIEHKTFEALKPGMYWHFCLSPGQVIKCRKSVKILNDLYFYLDCSTTIYEPMITTIPFRRCDESNLGVSTFCSLDNQNLPYPTKFSQQVINEYNIRPPPIPKFVDVSRILFKSVTYPCHYISITLYLTRHSWYFP